MAGAQGDPAKWHMPGWKIERPYSTRVLMGNWSEERLRFIKNRVPSNTSYRIDFGTYFDREPDCILRRAGEKRMQGIGKERLIDHHGRSYYNNNITIYDQNYNGKEGKVKLPKLRHWDSNKLGWVPEKTDHPVDGDPTNWGLCTSKSVTWGEDLRQRPETSYISTYRGSYAIQPEVGGRVRTRFAHPREMSTTMLKYNLSNKDLDLRDNKPVALEMVDPLLTTPPTVTILPGAGPRAHGTTSY